MLTRKALLMVAATAFAAGCSGGSDAPPVARLTFGTNHPTATIGSPLELTYQFDVLPDAKIDGDYTVFVHVLDADGDMMWTDDHEPPTRTSEWKAGTTVGPYTRTVFVPEFPYTGQATIVAGLYKPGSNDRLALAANAQDSTSGRHEYKVGTLEILPARGDVRLTSGWHDPEGSPSDFANQSRWTSKSAVIILPNPRADATLYLESDARPDVFDPDQTVTILANGQPVATFIADNAQRRLRRIPISAAAFGDGAMAELRIEVDRTFVPANLPTPSPDTRELGIRVFHVFVESR